MKATGFIDRSLDGIVRALAHAMEAEEVAHQSGLLQRLDPRVKVVGLTGLIVAAAISRSLAVIVSTFAGAVLIALLSHVSLDLLTRRIWVGVLLFTGVITLPALFTTPGESVARLTPFHLTITRQGLRSSAYLVARTETAATLALLLVLCTPWTEVLKALRSFGVPVTLVAILGMTHRYIFLLLETAHQMFQSRQSRTVGVMTGAEKRRIATRTAGVLMDKSLRLSEDVYMAMRARGFVGEVRTLSQFKLVATDYLALGAFLAATAGALWAGR